MEKINCLSLYIINKVKYIRLVLGKSANQLSLDIKKSENYIAGIENKKTPYQYNSADYPLIAKELSCEISDIIPPDDFEVSTTHDKVDKVVVSLKDEAFALKVLQGIEASPKAYVLENIDDLLKHLGLTTKYPDERIVVEKVWQEFISK